MLAALGPALFQQCRPLKVVVVLGAAVSRPLEAYELQYLQHAETAAREYRDLPPSQSRQYCQKGKTTTARFRYSGLAQSGEEVGVAAEHSHGEFALAVPCILQI